MESEKKKVKRPEGPPSQLLVVNLGTVTVSDEEDEDDPQA